MYVTSDLFRVLLPRYGEEHNVTKPMLNDSSEDYNVEGEAGVGGRGSLKKNQGIWQTSGRVGPSLCIYLCQNKHITVVSNSGHCGPDLVSVQPSCYQPVQ